MSKVHQEISMSIQKLKAALKLKFEIPTAFAEA